MDALHVLMLSRVGQIITGINDADRENQALAGRAAAALLCQGELWHSPLSIQREQGKRQVLFVLRLGCVGIADWQNRSPG